MYAVEMRVVVMVSNSSVVGGYLGPLLGLRKFHVSMLCHCSLHNVNLGIAQDANGSTLILGWQVARAYCTSC